MYKLVVSDMDGTLLDENKKVTKSTKEYLRKFIDDGNRFTIATGRIYPAVKMHSDDIGIKTPLICCNGAVIVNPVTDEIIYEKTIDIDIATEIAKICKEYDLYFHFYDKDTIYSEKDELFIKYFREVSETLPEEHKIKTQLVANIEETFKVKSIYKIGLHYDNSKQALEIRNRIENIEGIIGFKSMDVMLDFMATGVSKGSALVKLCDHEGLHLSQTIAFGDNENDIDMLMAAGVGIAMGNAGDEIKKIANKICLKNSEDGVINMIKEIF
jgi:Cof subfamily protein (haloacid dehalogenase superfamily)